MVWRVVLFSLCWVLILSGCSNGGGKKKETPLPVIEDINSATDPKSPTGVAIEINGTYFGSSPGYVRFEEGTNIADVVPDSSGWSDDGIIVVVPSSGSEGAFSVPGTVTVYVIRADSQKSNGVELDLVDVPPFNPSNMEWGSSTLLPSANAGLKAVAVPSTDLPLCLRWSDGYRKCERCVVCNAYGLRF